MVLLGTGTQGNSCRLAHFHEHFNPVFSLLAKTKQNSNRPPPHMPTCLFLLGDNLCTLAVSPLTLPHPVHLSSTPLTTGSASCHSHVLSVSIPPSLCPLADGPPPCCAAYLSCPHLQLNFSKKEPPTSPASSAPWQ